MELVGASRDSTGCGAMEEGLSGFEESINTPLWVSIVEGEGTSHGPSLIRSTSAGLNDDTRTAFLVMSLSKLWELVMNGEAWHATARI